MEKLVYSEGTVAGKKLIWIVAVHPKGQLPQRRSWFDPEGTFSPDYVDKGWKTSNSVRLLIATALRVPCKESKKLGKIQAIVLKWNIHFFGI